jgi:hypothetical protein
MSTQEFFVTQDRDRLPLRRVATIAVLGVIVAVGSVVVSGAIENCEIRVQRTGIASSSVPRPIGTVETRLANNSRRGLDLVAEQKRTLESYGWIDRERGIVRIPIDRAIDLTAEPRR